MAKVRVYELAKEFGVESKTVMRELQNMGEFVRSASSTVEAPAVRRLRQHFAGQPPHTEVTWSPPAGEAWATERYHPMNTNSGPSISFPSAQATQLPGAPPVPARALGPLPQAPRGASGPTPRPGSPQSAELSRSPAPAVAKGQPPSDRSSPRWRPEQPRPRPLIHIS